MISQKRNTNKQLVPATGLRSRSSSIYKPNQFEKYKISRSKFSDFLTCKRCFYLDRVKGLVSPSTPGWTLNETTDLLLKKEFDLCREKQVPHRICEQNNLNHIIPFKHDDIGKWRDALHHGLKIKFKNSNIILHGGVDDIWMDKNTNELIIVDYKSQAKKDPVNTEDYLSDPYHEGYKVQMDFYSYLLTEMKIGHSVSPISYFYVCNADRNASYFNSKLVFEETLVPYEWNSGWIEDKVTEMIALLNSGELPEANPSCENCAYAHQRAINENVVLDQATGDDDQENMRKRNCPKCGSDKVIPIVYGDIDGSPGVMKRIEEGEFEPGGCCVDNDSPKWKCRDCEEKFGRIDWA